MRSKMRKCHILVTAVISFLAACPLYSQEDKADTRGALLYDEIRSSKIPWQTIGHSVEGREIYLLELGEGDSTTIVFGAFHGNEYLSPKFVFAFARTLYFDKNPQLSCRLIIVPVVNPDGLVSDTRTNANKVDINRNFPTRNWQPNAKSTHNHPGPSAASEPETQLVIEILERYKPQRIVSVHTPLSMNNYDGPAKAMASRMAEKNGYSVEADIGYPTPGSFGTYAGKEKLIPTVTLELPPSVSNFKDVWSGNHAALLTTLQYK